MTIDEALKWAKPLVPEPSDAVYLLCNVLNQPSSYLYTWPDKTLEREQYYRFETFVKRRQNGEPVAYITGQKAFWTLTLNTSEHTLIPRPESEILVEQAMLLTDDSTHLDVCDLGTGTGAIALSIASERHNANVIGVDRIPQAVELAMQNAVINNIDNVNVLLSDWFSALNGYIFDIIVSNPPYVETSSMYLDEGDVRFEPRSALTSGEDGLDDIRHIVMQSTDYLKNNGWLLIEHGWQQHESVASMMQTKGFVDIRGVADLNHKIRVTLGRFILSGGH